MTFGADGGIFKLVKSLGDITMTLCLRPLIFCYSFVHVWLFDQESLTLPHPFLWQLRLLCLAKETNFKQWSSWFIGESARIADASCEDNFLFSIFSSINCWLGKRVSKKPRSSAFASRQKYLLEIMGSFLFDGWIKIDLCRFQMEIDNDRMQKNYVGIEWTHVTFQCLVQRRADHMV